MKRFVTVLAATILLTISANADCGSDAQSKLYNKFLEHYTGKPEQKKIAHQTGKEYLSKYAECSSEPEKKITRFLTKWLADYEVELDETICSNAVYNKPADAFRQCQAYVTRDPENLRAHLLLSLAGIKYLKTGGKQLKQEMLTATRKANELIKAGRSVDRWLLGPNREETAAALEFYGAYLTLDSAPSETAKSMLSLARSGSSYSKDPTTFYYLGLAIEEAEIVRPIDEYNRDCAGKEPTPACEEADKKIDSALDRAIDAYARAVALSVGKAEYAGVSSLARTPLVNRYKQRHKSEAGLDEFIAEVLSKPIP